VPLELIIPERRSVELREYEEEPLKPGEVRVRSTFSSNKHGTLLRKYRGDVDNWHTAFEREHRISREEPSLPSYPRHVGNMTVGTVTEVGADVEDFAVGNRVYGHLPIRETHAVPEADLRHAPEGMDPEAIVFTNPAGVGVHLVRGGGVQLGDAVAVFGAGAIGLMAAQLARVGGARRVVVSEPIGRRRAAAREHGADLVLDPTEEDAARRIKTAVAAGDEAGVDRALETSASYAGLDDAVRAVAFEGTVASCGYYEGDASALGLGAEFHRNAVEIRSVQPGSSGVLENHPRWNYEHLHEEAFAHLRDGRISAEGLIDPVVSLAAAPDALREVETNPEGSIKLGVVYDG
jgi:threonine dehydrogenase-like Zn-dependent dehydrogenase